MKEYIKDNHIDRIEDMIHQLAYSKPFLDQFIEEENRHEDNVSKLKRKDISIGDDVDIYVKHFTEHQNFTMILVPISIYSLAIYDTLLFSVLEVTDNWLERGFPYEDLKDESVKSSILSLKNHDLLAEHLYDQTLKNVHSSIGQFKIHLQESYISTNSVHEHMGNMSKEEKDLVRHNWGLLKKAFSHDVDLNVELNIYVFGFNDLEVLCKNKKGNFTYKITPNNIFKRHHFADE
ncbi:MAG: hypothetical protein JXR07_17755 [Reichenbachiella sp.]